MYGQAQPVHVLHQVAEHAALAAAGGDHAAGGFFFDAVDAGAGFDGGGPHIPVHRDRFNLIQRRHQTLVAQIAQHQPFGVATQRHQGDQLPFVHIHREGTLCRNGDGARLSILVSHVHRASQASLRGGQAGAAGDQDFLAPSLAAGAAGAAAGAGAEAAAALAGAAGAAATGGTKGPGSAHAGVATAGFTSFLAAAAVLK